MMKPCFFAILLLAFFLMPFPVNGTEAYSPKKSSPERKAVLDTLRAHLKKELNIDAVFVVDYLKIKAGWAWIEVNPRSSDGNNWYEPMGVLLQLEKGNWKILDFSPGECTGDEKDSPDCNPEHFFNSLESKYKAPRDIFPDLGRK